LVALIGQRPVDEVTQQTAQASGIGERLGREDAIELGATFCGHHRVSFPQRGRVYLMNLRTQNC
jgi:hypothetical protein